MKKFMIVFSLILTAYSCEKEEDISRFFWDQTKCSDPWNTTEIDSNQETIIAISNYLERNGVRVENVDFDNNSSLDSQCESCACGTGQRIVVDVYSNDNKKMKELDFYQ